MQVTMQVPVVCFLFTEERSEGFVKFSRIGFKIFCFPLPVFLDNLSSVFCSNVPPPSLYFPIFICSVVCILLGIFSFKFNCIFLTRCQSHCLSGQFAFQQWCQIEFSKNGIYHPVCQRYPWYSMDHRLDPQ